MCLKKKKQTHRLKTKYALDNIDIILRKTIEKRKDIKYAIHLFLSIFKLIYIIIYIEKILLANSVKKNCLNK